MSLPLITNNRVLVTGGAGFIGSNLCEELLKHDNEVVCLDNFSTGRMVNITGCLENRNFKLITGDIRNPEDCKTAVDGIDIILKSAPSPSPMAPTGKATSPTPWHPLPKQRK